MKTLTCGPAEVDVTSELGKPISRALDRERTWGARPLSMRHCRRDLNKRSSCQCHSGQVAVEFCGNRDLTANRRSRDAILI